MRAGREQVCDSGGRYVPDHLLEHARLDRHGVERRRLRLRHVRRQAQLAEGHRLRQPHGGGRVRGRRPEHRRRGLRQLPIGHRLDGLRRHQRLRPAVAAIYALGGAPSSGSSPASFPYAHTSALYDVTSGSDGSCGGSYLCTGTTGYDGPTGLGVPNGTAAFTG